MNQLTSICGPTKKIATKVKNIIYLLINLAVSWVSKTLLWLPFHSNEKKKYKYIVDSL